MRKVNFFWPKEKLLMCERRAVMVMGKEILQISQ